MDALGLMEGAMRFAQFREAMLSSDAANASSAGFEAKDVALVPRVSAAGVRFAAALRGLPASGPVASIEYAMGAIAKNAVWYRSLTQQTRAILREYKTVAEEARR
ncbi:MAG: hypothetical protein JO219_09680 [Candidatus Eremiobacteraeota bacterium]|nr:hypothetical protein [Candidatus Eremiobacteraeota bacterium]MBV8366346.1 hypothetical protein [Candidatus Eremiobacteraeota bacterium]